MGRFVDLPGFDADDEHYFRDIYEHLIRISDLIDSFRDLLSSAMDVYLYRRQPTQLRDEAPRRYRHRLPAAYLHHWLLRTELRRPYVAQVSALARWRHHHGRNKAKVVVITRASSGIGHATALLLAARGAAVVLGARRTDSLTELVDGIRERGGGAAMCSTDDTRREDLARLVGLAVDQFGRLDVLVSNAGINKIGPMAELDVDGALSCAGRTGASYEGMTSFIVTLQQPGDGWAPGRVMPSPRPVRANRRATPGPKTTVTANVTEASGPRNQRSLDPTNTAAEEATGSIPVLQPPIRASTVSPVVRCRVVTAG